MAAESSFCYNILKQIRSYLEGEISKEEYYNIAEQYYNKYVDSCDNIAFKKCFLDNISDACLLYIDEPGLTSEEREKQFFEVLKSTYELLLNLQ